MARAPVSKTGGWGFESLHSCQHPNYVFDVPSEFLRWGTTWGTSVFSV